MELETAFRRAETLLGQGQHRKALDAYRDLLGHRLAAVGTDDDRFTSLDLVLVERLAELAVLFGASQPADQLLHGMAELCRNAGNVFGADWATVKRVQIALAEDRLQKAEDLLSHLAPTVGDHRQLEITDAGLRRWVAACRFAGADHRQVLLPAVCLILGLLLAALGQFGQGLLVLDTGIESLAADHPDLAQRLRRPLHLARASALLQMGELASAGHEIDTLEDESELAEEPAQAVRHHELAAQLALLQGRYGAARRRLEAVLELCHRGDFTAARLTARLNLARVLALLNHTRQAEELAAGLPAQARELGLLGLAARAEALLPILRARRQSLVPEVRAGSLAIAPPVIESWHPTPPAAASEEPAEAQNVPLFDLPPAADFLTWYEDRELAFRWTLTRNLPAAARLLAQMNAVFRSTDSALLHARLDALQGLVAYYSEHLDDAEVWLESARTSFQAMGLLPELWQTQRALGWCWARLGCPEEQQRELAKENEKLLQQLAGSLEGADRAVYLLNKWTAEEEALAHRIDALTDLRTRPLSGSWPRRLVARLQRRWRELHRLHELLDELDRYGDLLAREALGGNSSNTDDSGENGDSPAHRAVPASRRPSVWRRLLTHPLRSTTLRFLVLPDRVVTVQRGWCRLDFAVAPATRIQIRELVARWHRAMLATARTRDLVLTGDDGEKEPADWSSATADDQESIATEISDTLRLPALFDSLPRRTRRLRLVLDDSLHGFPFAALRHRGAYLVERWALSTATGLSNPSANVSPSSAALSQRHDRVLLVGVSRATADPPLPPLPGVAREIASLGEDFQGRGWEIQELTNAQADRRTVAEALAHADLAHLACHGLFRPDRPDASGLFLIPGDGRKAQLLSLRDLARLDLRGLRHVTLSACWSADNYILPGRRILSLPEALTRAGAASVLSHLWPLDDAVAVSLMQRFYHHLRTLPRDEALRQTQLECLRRPETGSAYFWAGLRLVGESARLRH